MVVITNELRDHIADFDDFWRPVRNYFYWEPHCFDIPICWSLRSIFDAMDGVDRISDKFHDVVTTSINEVHCRISPKTSINSMRSCRSC